MIKYITIWLVLFMLPLSLVSQNTIDSVLVQVSKNNTRLIALQKNAEAEKLGNKTGILPDNPEFGFNYLWGDPSSIGNRTDISITQTFDFPTAYQYKNQISNLKNQQVELEYVKQQKNILLQTRLICYDLVYTNALKAELNKRLVHAKSIARSYQAKFEIGESNVLENNKAQLNLLNLSKEFESLEIERNDLLSALSNLNGGIFIDFKDSVFSSPEIPVDFEQWFVQAEQKNPILSWLKQEIEISQKQVSLNRAMSLPKLRAGYMSEKVVGENFQGITAGISIPLWENKNRTKYAKAYAMAMESIAADNKIQFYNELKYLHAKAIALQKNTLDYRKAIGHFDNSYLFKKALDKGEITLIDYMLEFSIYYQSVTKLLELERDMNKTFAELNQNM